MVVDPKNVITICTADVPKYQDLIIAALEKGLTIRLETLEPTWYDICVMTSYDLPALVIGEEVVRPYFDRFEPASPVVA